MTPSSSQPLCMAGSPFTRRGGKKSPFHAPFFSLLSLATQGQTLFQVAANRETSGEATISPPPPRRTPPAPWSGRHHHGPRRRGAQWGRGRSAEPDPRLSGEAIRRRFGAFCLALAPWPALEKIRAYGTPFVEKVGITSAEKVPLQLFCN